jgi:hypothetical protein
MQLFVSTTLFDDDTRLRRELLQHVDVACGEPIFAQGSSDREGAEHRTLRAQGNEDRGPHRSQSHLRLRGVRVARKVGDRERLGLFEDARGDAVGDGEGLAEDRVGVQPDRHADLELVGTAWQRKCRQVGVDDLTGPGGDELEDLVRVRAAK